MSPLREIRSATSEEIDRLKRSDKEKEEREKAEMGKIEKLLIEEGFAVLNFSEGWTELDTRKVTVLEQIQKMGKKIREHMHQSPEGDENLAFSYTLEDSYKGTLIARIRK